ncbi:MAG: hypothetical protein OXU45_00560, partial [Candidatus Melainabacteria bacterium]|nr:hypothetical protein [Candidatus Melainabacteria bacterium]
EVHNDGAKIYNPNQYRDLSFEPKYIEQLPAEIKTTINELEELQTKIINIPTYISATATIERLFYYDLQITDKKIEITKSKFKKEQDNKNWWGTTLIMSSTYRTFAVPVIVVSLSLSHFMSSDQWKLLCKFFLIPGFIVLVSYVLFVLPFQWTRLIAKLRSKSDELFVDLLLNILG